MFQAPPREIVSLRLEPSEQGTRIVDLRSGLGFVVPDVVAVYPGRGGMPTFDVALRCMGRPIDLRLRIDPLTSPPSPQHAMLLCATYATNRTVAPAQAGLAPVAQLQAWQVDAAASAIYPLRQLEDGFDYEECFCALKSSASRVLVLTKRFSSTMLTPPVWAEFNGRLNASLCWGAEHSTSAPMASFFVDGEMALSQAAAAYAHTLALELVATRAPRRQLDEVCSGLRGVVFGSDSPDTRMDPQLPGLLRGTVFGNVTSDALLMSLQALLTERVATYRDLRGLVLLLEEALRAMPMEP